MTPTDTFDVLILNARPAAGKSEIIHHLKHTDDAARRATFHIGPFVEIDDFPMLFTWFEEDEILETTLSHPRLHTDEDGYFIDERLWHLLIERISLEYHKLLAEHPTFHDEGGTVIVEFSRGVEHGGYAAAYQHLAPDLLARAALLYLDVTYEESVRKNRRRFNPDRPYSILEHGLSDEKMERLYKEDDFKSLVTGSEGTLVIRDQPVPYVIFDNHDDVTTNSPALLDARLADRLGRLWAIYQATEKSG